ncbi:MAG TPA: asparagine synthase (glutamine-hydrolyzing) [Longimicrobiales bacterium]|nr:asparagine synthase (glutamine-hydrolyzing) [Longimicrobiales bacterium]
MCGLAGIFASEPRVAGDAASLVERMSARLAHRGPDDHGVWADAEAGIALAFRRLAIIDLSAHGHQPMASASGRFVMVFNGEVYNYRELREELARSGAAFHGGSDSEVILAAVEAWGVRAAVRRFIGMFAIALWDRRERRLHLLRDRLGIKPLFVFAGRGVVAFASELKALAPLPCFERRVDARALVGFLRYLYVPGPGSIFEGVRKLEPGHLLTIADPASPLPAAVPYWRLEEVARACAAAPFTGSDDEAVDEGERLLQDAVALRMRSDVPVGAFLSGGIDSSTVAALMQRCSPTPVRTFTIGFRERDFDEAEPAARVARHLGTDHTQVYLGGEDALRLVPELPEVFDEPFADPSELPTCLVCRMARREVTVALSGDGGDEVFAGYNRYIAGERVLRPAARVPGPLRRLAAAGMTGVSPAAWDRVSRGVAPVLPARLRPPRFGDKVHKAGAFLRLGGAPTMYRSLLSAWQQPAALVEGGVEEDGAVEQVLRGDAGPDLLHRMMLADQATYLVDDLLAKVDRASMAVSLEVRVPLLDHRVVEYSWRLPRRLKVRGGTGKWILRRILDRHVPAALVDRAKMGFSVPIDAWLRGPLRDWADDLLSESELRRSGLLRPEPIQAEWRRFRAGGGRAGLALWAVLVFQGWARRWAA